MKRIISMLACAALIVCSCQKDPKPEVSFTSGNYVMGADEALTVKVVTNMAPAADLTVEFTTSGTAVLGSDYELSAETVTIKAGETEGEITVTPLNNLGSNLNINLALTLPAGYEAGKFTSAVIALASKEKIAYSFAVRSSRLVSETDIILNLIGLESGANFVAGGDLHIPFTVDAASTATLGTDFSIKDNATEFFVAKGSKSAKITLCSLAESAEDAKEVIIKIDETALNQAYSGRFESGVVSSTKAIMTDKLTFALLEGKWAYASTPILDDPEADLSMFTMFAIGSGDAEWLDEAETQLSITGFPTGTSSDILEFKTSNGKQSLVPVGNGSILNYFRECEVTALTPTNFSWYNYYPARPLDATTVSLSNANVAYSASTEILKPIDIIINLSDDGNTLDVFITPKSYVPTDFFINSYAILGEMWGIEGMEDHVGPYELYFTFTRVE